MKKNLLAVLIIISNVVAQAQLFYNKGASIYSNPGSIIKIQGSFSNNLSGNLNNNGLMVIDSSYINNKTAISTGNGIYDVYVNWVNSGTFKRDTSTVNLKGTIQLIKGDSVTRFYNLNLLGIGVKKQELNSEVNNKLNLSINELATQQDTMFLKNGNTSSLLGSFAFGSEGFISNLDTGAFVRLTNSNNSYYYPMGNNSGTSLFRPIEITPNGSNLNEYAVSFYNFNATVKTYSVNSKAPELCLVNNKFFHQVGRLVGNTSIDLNVGYLKNVDGNFNTIGNWKSVNTEWNDITNVTYTNTIGSYDANKRLNWSNFSNLPYSLASSKPVINSVNGNTLVCNGASINYSVNLNPSFNYDWSVTGGIFNNNDSTSNSVNVSYLGFGTHTLQLLVTDLSSNCVSDAFTEAITVGQGPTAGFTTTTSGGLYQSNSPINILDQSINATGWNYDFGNNSTNTNQNTSTIYYTPGEFTITQIVSDSFGCTDTLRAIIKIETIDDMPNVFSPNNDGTNDIFEFNCNGCVDYTIDITNRWGSLVYTGNKGSAFWDGTNGTGEALSDGTYFYILKLKYKETEKIKKGFIQLIK